MISLKISPARDRCPSPPADPPTPLFLCARPNVCAERELAAVGQRQPCARAFTRTVKVWKQDCGGRQWCAGYERRYVLFLRARFAPRVRRNGFRLTGCWLCACPSWRLHGWRGPGTGGEGWERPPCARPAAQAVVGHGRQPRDPPEGWW